MVIVVPEVIVEGGVKQLNCCDDAIDDERNRGQLFGHVLELLRAFGAIEVQRVHRADDHIVARIGRRSVIIDRARRDVGITEGRAESARVGLIAAIGRQLEQSAVTSIAIDHLEAIPRLKEDLVLLVKAQRQGAVYISRTLAAVEEHLDGVALAPGQSRRSAIPFTEDIEVVMTAVGSSVAGLGQGGGSSDCQA